MSEEQAEGLCRRMAEEHGDDWWWQLAAIQGEHARAWLRDLRGRG